MPMIRFGDEIKGDTAMKNLLTIVSGTALTAAAVVAVIALTAGGQAAAQDAPATTITDSGAPISQHGVDTLSDIADQLIDTLVAEGILTPDQADEARSALDEAEATFSDIDWDVVEKQIDLGVARLKSEIASADWDDIRNELEDALAELQDADFEEFDLGELDFDPDSIDWSKFEDGFDRFKDEIESFDLDEAREEFERHLGGIDWDDVSERFRDGLEQFDFESFKDRADQLRKQFEGMDLDDLRKQFENQF